MNENNVNIVDTHIHLWPQSHIANGINWMSESKPCSLYKQLCVNEYVDCLPSQHNVSSFIFVEADRRYNEEVDQDWSEHCREFEYACQVAEGGKNNTQGEGFNGENGKMIVGYVAWAPINKGSSVCDQYLQKLLQVKNSDPSLLKGFRYLIQDKPDGSFLSEKFIEGVQWCGKNNFHFEICLDYQNRGELHIQEAAQLVKKVNQDSQQQTLLVIDHMGKPDLRLKPEEIETSPVFQIWKKNIEEMASFPKVYMKLSGLLSYLPPLSQFKHAKEIVPFVLPYVKVVLKAFGSKRIMWGSDWPVLNMNFRKEEGKENWEMYKTVTLESFKQLEVSEHDQQLVFQGNANYVYKLTR
eukprot:TRINITY_DN6613_c0_g1_i1.p1 TRINITY_DN6613_c0_g1~~TRINITY_DN6613_c0_g1_i1.p1  ORF type:complete len:353 (+),score=108.51 TRINITY_DN6613_c0_g1_i1:113-1171(+)